MIIHYLFLPQALILYAFIFEELVKFAAFFLVSYYYCQEASDFLSSKQWWLRALKAVVVIGFLFEAIFLISLIIRDSIDKKDNSDLCLDPIFIVLRSGG